MLQHVIGVLLARGLDFVQGTDVSIVVALAAVNTSCRRAVLAWFSTIFISDLSHGHESLALPVRGAHVGDLGALLGFCYQLHAAIPLPSSMHMLPPDVRARQHQQDLVQRVVRGREIHLYVAKTSCTRWGVYAAQHLPIDTFVGTYAGEVISTTELRRRDVDYATAHGNYVLALREHSIDADAAIVRTNIDATMRGNFTRFVNHSCRPNMRMHAIRVDSYVPVLALVTTCAVPRDVELTFDYGEDAAPSTTPCRCGAATCRGFLPGA